MPPACRIIQFWSISLPATRPSSPPMSRAVFRSASGMVSTMAATASNLPSIQSMTSSARASAPKYLPSMVRVDLMSSISSTVMHSTSTPSFSTAVTVSGSLERWISAVG